MTFDKSKPQGKCIDVNGDTAIFKRLASLAYETGSKASDPCEAMLTHFGNGMEIFGDLLEVHDGWQVGATLKKKQSSPVSVITHGPSAMVLSKPKRLKPLTSI